MRIAGYQEKHQDPATWASLKHLSPIHHLEPFTELPTCPDFTAPFLTDTSPISTLSLAFFPTFQLPLPNSCHPLHTGLERWPNPWTQSSQYHLATTSKSACHGRDLNSSQPHANTLGALPIAPPLEVLAKAPKNQDHTNRILY